MRCFEATMNVRGNLAGDVLASLTTMQWNVPSMTWTAALRSPTRHWIAA